MRIEPRNRRRRTVDFRPADVARRVQDLTLQIGQGHEVFIDDSDEAAPARGKILDQGRAKAARSDDQNAGVFELVLSWTADPAQNNMAGVAFDLFAGKRH